MGNCEFSGTGFHFLEQLQMFTISAHFNILFYHRGEGSQDVLRDRWHGIFLFLIWVQMIVRKKIDNKSSILSILGEGLAQPNIFE